MLLTLSKVDQFCISRIYSDYVEFLISEFVENVIEHISMIEWALWIHWGQRLTYLIQFWYG